MSSSDPTRRRLVLSGLALFGLVACGYEPVLAPGSPGRGLIGRVAIEAPRNERDFALVSALEDRLGRGASGPYALAYSVSLKSERVAITKRGDTNRYNLAGTASYDLTGPDGKRIRKGEVRSFTSYSASGTTVATEAARRDAETRLMRVLAEAIVTRLYADTADVSG